MLVLAVDRECLDVIKRCDCVGILLEGEYILVFDRFWFSPWVASLY